MSTSESRTEYGIRYTAMAGVAVEPTSRSYAQEDLDKRRAWQAASWLNPRVDAAIVTRTVTVTYGDWTEAAQADYDEAQTDTPDASRTGDILRLASQIIRTQRDRLSAVPAIRIAAGPGRENHQAAETALSWLVHHLEYDLVEDLKDWQSRTTTERIHEELASAAQAAEDGGR